MGHVFFVHGVWPTSVAKGRGMAASDGATSRHCERVQWWSQPGDCHRAQTVFFSLQGPMFELVGSYSNMQMVRIVEYTLI